MANIQVQLRGVGYAKFAHDFFRLPNGQPDNDTYVAYKSATEGVKYIRDLREVLAPLDKVPGILVRLRDAGFDVDADAQLVRVLQERTAQQWLDLKSAQERIARIDEELWKLKGQRLYPFQRTGALWLTLRYGALLADEMGLGKLAAVSEPVLTPTGWSTMGALRAGDEVIGSDGRPTTVVRVFPQGKKKQYRVTLTDGCSTRAGAEHLWYVETTNTRFRKTLGRVMTTKELMAEGLYSNPSCGRATGNAKWFIPIVRPVRFRAQKHILDPYVIGALIANGGLTGYTPMIHVGGEDQLLEVERTLPTDLELRRLSSKVGSNGKRASICSSSDPGSIRRVLMGLDLLKKSYEKRVPASYLMGSVAQRTSLLQGLMDNDGTITGGKGIPEYNTTSPGLAEDVLALIRSLGGSAWMSTRIPTFTYKGEKKKGRRDHRIRFSLPNAIVPFRLPRKLSLYKPRTKYPPAHAIVSIEPCGIEESVCIKVAAKDHLYVTKDFILTHNTLQAIVSLPPNVPALIVAPAVAKGVWRGEFRTWRPQRQVSMLSGRDSFHWPRGDEILVTNYDILPQIHDVTGALTGRACEGHFPPVPCKACAIKVVMVGDTPRTVKEGHLEACNERGNFLPLVHCPGCHPFLKDAPPHMVLIADEAHYLKSMKADRTRRFRALSDAVRKKEGRVWLLTGTPLENKPPELWAVFQAAGIAEEAFGDFDSFVEMFKGQALPYGGYEWGLPDDDIRERLRRVTLRRMRVDVLPQLPVKVWSDYEVELDAHCVRACEKFLKEQGKDVEQIIRMLESGKMDFDKIAMIRAALATAKIPAMIKIVQDFEERDEPLIVFSAHRAPIDTLEKRPGWAVITGDVSPDKRKEIEEHFEAGSDRERLKKIGKTAPLKGVGLTIRAGGVALTLVRANTALFVDRDWKPTANAQAEDRLVRIGQKRGVIIMTLYGNHPLDERVTEVLEKKTRLISASVDTAATTDDAPMAQAAKEFEDQLHRIQEEIACGRAIRRMAESPEQEAALEGLHVVTFNSSSDERIGMQLAEEALAIGLSKAQWDLARKIVARGRVPDTPEEAYDVSMRQRAEREPTSGPRRPTSEPRSGEKRGGSLNESKRGASEPASEPAPKQELESKPDGPAPKGPTTWGRRRR